MITGFISNHVKALVSPNLTEIGLTIWAANIFVVGKSLNSTCLDDKGLVTVFAISRIINRHTNLLIGD
jgi:hypothetical protein